MIPYFFISEIAIGPLSLPVYPLAHGLAFTIMGLLFLSEARRKGLSHEKFFKVFAWSFVGAIIGARLGGVIKHWDYFKTHLDEVCNFAQGGWTEAGGFLLASILGIGAILVVKLPLKESLDAVAPALAARFAISRFGCTAIHDHVGKVMEYPWPWGIAYDGTVRHETAMYSLVFMWFLFFILWFLRKRLKLPGLLFAIHLLGYSFLEFLTRFFRAEDLPLVSDQRYVGLTATQYILILVFLAGVFFLEKIVSVRYTYKERKLPY